MRRRLLVLLSLLLALCSCVNDKHLVQNATATYIWENQQYKKQCVSVKGPPDCKKRFEVLNELLDDATVANEAQKIGKLPPSAVKKLKADMKQMGQ